jgi:predicted DNA-binding transcriptional regulator AlpA
MYRWQNPTANSESLREVAQALDLRQRPFLLFKRVTLALLEGERPVTHSKPHKLIEFRALREYVPFGETQLKHLIRQGLFPAPVRLSTRRQAWIEAEVTAWQEKHIAERDAPGSSSRNLLPEIEFPRAREQITAQRWKPNT